MNNKYKEIVRSVPNSDCVFKYVEVSRGTSLPIWEMEQNILLFVLEGKLKVTYQDGRFFEVDGGSFAMIPKLSEWKGTGLQHTTLIVFTFSKVDNVWTKPKIKTLLEVSPNAPDEKQVVLPIKEPLAAFLDLVSIYTIERDIDKSFYALKENELLSLLYTFYPVESMARMFQSVLRSNTDFKSFVLANYLRVDSASELAELAGCSMVTLNRRFKEYFNDSAYQWMIKNKMTQIQRRLQNPSSSLGEIAKEFGFYSGSELNRFCQRQFGTTALRLRKCSQQKEKTKS